MRRKADAPPGWPALVEEPMPATACVAVGVRPAGSTPTNPHHVVVALRTRDDLSRLYELDKEHDIELPPRDWEALSLDGWGAEARFYFIGGMAWDEERGRLYVSDRSAIRSVHPGTGEVATLLGSLAPEARGFAPAPLPVAGLAPGQPCLSSPGHLALDKRVLFVADSGNHAVRAFNLQQRLLYTLVGDRTQGEFRSGPLGCVEPDLLPGECAALDRPFALALAPRGEGPTRVMVIDQTGVATFGLPPDHAVAPRRRAPAAEARKERKEGKEGKEEKRY